MLDIGFVAVSAVGVLVALWLNVSCVLVGVVFGARCLGLFEGGTVAVDNLLRDNRFLIEFSTPPTVLDWLLDEECETKAEVRILSYLRFLGSLSWISESDLSSDWDFRFVTRVYASMIGKRIA